MSDFMKELRVQVLETKAVEIEAEYIVNISDKSLTVTRKIIEKHNPILEEDGGAEFLGTETIILNEDLDSLFNTYCVSIAEEMINKDLSLVADKINKDLSASMAGTVNITPVTIQEKEPEDPGEQEAPEADNEDPTVKDNPP